jgi:hypothetical protein
MRLLCFATAVVFGSCDRSTTATPEGRFRRFSELIRKGDAENAFVMLSSSSQSALQRQSKTLSEASKGTIKDEPAALAFASARRAHPLLSVTVQEQTEVKAVLNVRTCRLPLDARGECSKGADVQETVTMVKEGSNWSVELTELVMP